MSTGNFSIQIIPINFYDRDIRRGVPSENVVIRSVVYVVRVSGIQREPESPGFDVCCYRIADVKFYRYFNTIFWLDRVSYIGCNYAEWKKNETKKKILSYLTPNYIQQRQSSLNLALCL
ncbi:hypothetical protein CRG92_00260 [Escherichia sp. E2586]|nr:hypothetical protein CRG92_00260 [Escherichia sp. E2586]